MSLGHMTKQEQAITLGGVFILMPIAGNVGHALAGETGIVVGIFVAIGLTFVGKAWAWQYTDYENGFSNPKFDRGKSDEE